MDESILRNKGCVLKSHKACWRVCLVIWKLTWVLSTTRRARIHCHNAKTVRTTCYDFHMSTVADTDTPASLRSDKKLTWSVYDNIPRIYVKRPLY